MQYSLRWINRRAYDRASELCTNALALRVTLVFLSTLVCHTLFGSVAGHRPSRHARRALARRVSNNPASTLPFLSMPPPSRPFISRIASQVVRYGRQVVPVIATHARAIAIGVTMEIVEQMHRIVANMASRYVSVSSHLGNANVLQGEYDVRSSHKGYPRQPQRLGHAPRAGRICTCRVGLQGGHPPQSCCPLLGENGIFYLFFSLEMFADFVPHSRSPGDTIALGITAPFHSNSNVLVVTTTTTTMIAVAAAAAAAAAAGGPFHGTGDVLVVTTMAAAVAAAAAAAATTLGAHLH